jgi:hypothetical protein
MTLVALLCANSFAHFPARAQNRDIAVATSSPRKARVVTVCDPAATYAFQPRPELIKPMVDRGVTAVTGKATVAEAWRSLLVTNGSFASNELVGIKVFSTPGSNSGTRPAVVAAVVEGLLAAGLKPKQVVIWDKEAVHLRLAGYFDLADRYGISVRGSAQAGWDEEAYYTSPLIGNLVWGDLEFGRKGEGVGRKSFISKLVSRELTKIINVTPLLNHNLAGVAGNLYSFAVGSLDNTARFEISPGRLADAVPGIYELLNFNDRVVLNITDALICQYEGGERGLLHYSAVLNELRFSRDPVALDVLSLKDLERQRLAAQAPVVKVNSDLYANAAAHDLGINDLKRIEVDAVPPKP